jgi:hypothetical protein
MIPITRATTRSSSSPVTTRCPSTMASGLVASSRKAPEMAVRVPSARQRTRLRELCEATAEVSSCAIRVRMNQNRWLPVGNIWSPSKTSGRNLMRSRLGRNGQAPQKCRFSCQPCLWV